MKSFRILGPAAALAAAILIFAANVPQSENQLWEHRNLGKAFYENPDTHLQAVQELRAALRLKPDSVRERINYGLALLQAGQTDAGKPSCSKPKSRTPPSRIPGSISVSSINARGTTTRL